MVRTVRTYGMNGEALPVAFGAPVRLRVPRQLGYKNVKHLVRVLVTDSLTDIGKPSPASGLGVGFSWYAGI